MLKKISALSLAALMALSVLSGCGGQNSSSASAAAGDSASAAETGSGEEVTITYISSTILESPEGDFEQACIDEFNALDNGIHVEVEGVNANDLMKKYITLATSNSMPDFFLVNLLDTPTVVDMGLAAEAAPLFGEEYLEGFDEELFHALVERITAQSRTQVCFRLRGGLELTESLGEERR